MKQMLETFTVFKVKIGYHQHVWHVPWRRTKGATSLAALNHSPQPSLENLQTCLYFWNVFLSENGAGPIETWKLHIVSMFLVVLFLCVLSFLKLLYLFWGKKKYGDIWRHMETGWFSWGALLCLKFGLLITWVISIPKDEVLDLRVC